MSIADFFKSTKSTTFPFVTLLVIDGWGIGPQIKSNAIYAAATPNYDSLLKTYPHTQLFASGEHVGLPKGEDGNTEVGHLNIGAGRRVPQDLPRINNEIAKGVFADNNQIAAALAHVTKNKSSLHLLGLVGTGGVHSHIEHLWALLSAIKQKGLDRPVYLHLITDGRDSPPKSGASIIANVITRCKQMGLGEVVSVVGRYYAMDRDMRWDRTLIAYDALIGETVNPTTDIGEAVWQSYSAGKTDEFVQPITVVDEHANPKGLIQSGDSVIFFNFRIDRPRQLTKAFVTTDFNKMIKTTKVKRNKKLTNLAFFTMTEYEKGLPVGVLVPPEVIANGLSEVLANAGNAQIKIAETEKERFVTYYFNGQNEKPFPKEKWLTVPSKKVATYDLVPAMSTPEISSEVVNAIQSQKYNLIVANIAAPDMVAHTGKLAEAILACEATDKALGEIAQVVQEAGGVLLITADHGNAEELVDLSTNKPDTKHSTAKVPFIVVAKGVKIKKQKELALSVVAPTVLKLLGLPIPTEMTGKSVV